MTKIVLKFTEGNTPKKTGSYVVRYKSAGKGVERTGFARYNKRLNYWEDISGNSGQLIYETYESKTKRVRTPKITAFAQVT